MAIEIAKVTRILEDTAAEEILPRFQRLSDSDRRVKAGGEVVTVADEASEKRLTRELAALLPGSLVVGEEAAAADPGILNTLKRDGPIWIVDPIDGTSNFAAGTPIFAVMVALVIRGATRAAWIHDAPGRRTAVAEEGAGAWMEGSRLQTAAPAPLGEMSGTLHAGQHGGDTLRERVQNKRRALGAIRSLRCAGAEYIRLASGEMHYSLFTKLMPWDHAPGVLLHAEAGGFGRTAENQAYSPARQKGRGLLLAPNQQSWQQLYDELYSPSAGSLSVPCGP